MAPKEKQKIEIEKTHRDPLLSFNQAVTVDCSDFLGTALKMDLTALGKLFCHGSPGRRSRTMAEIAGAGTVEFCQDQKSHERPFQPRDAP
jgi:hypothetical protein